MAVMALKIETIEKNTHDVKQTLEDFISKADDKYASRREFEALKEAIKDEFKVITKEQSWTKEKIFAVSKDVAIALAIIGLFVKGFI